MAFFLIGSKCNSKVAEPYLILHRSPAQARPSSPNVTVSQLVEITSATSNTQWNTQNTQKSTTEMSQWSVMSWNANQISIIAEIPVRDEDFVFKFDLVLDSSSHNSGNALLAYCLLPITYCLLFISLNDDSAPRSRELLEYHMNVTNIEEIYFGKYR